MFAEIAKRQALHAHNPAPPSALRRKRQKKYRIVRRTVPKEKEVKHETEAPRPLRHPSVCSRKISLPEGIGGPCDRARRPKFQLFDLGSPVDLEITDGQL